MNHHGAILGAPPHGPAIAGALWHEGSRASTQVGLSWCCWSDGVPVRLYEIDHDRGIDGDISDLDDSERKRFARFLRPDDRQRFLRRRLALREICAAEIGCPSSWIQFSVGPAGKPFVSAPPTDLCFSVTTSGVLTLVATARTEIGLDCEHVRPDLVHAGTASLFLTAREYRHWVTRPPDRQVWDFFLAWTRKEAVTKASGLGLGNCPPDLLDVTWHPPEGLTSFTLRQGYVAALSTDAGLR